MNSINCTHNYRKYMQYAVSIFKNPRPRHQKENMKNISSANFTLTDF